MHEYGDAVEAPTQESPTQPEPAQEAGDAPTTPSFDTRELSPEEAALFDDLFTYHAPTGDQAARYAAINDAAKAFAIVVHRACPPSADRSAAIRKIREARMTANSSIATKTGGAYR